MLFRHWPIVTKLYISYSALHRRIIEQIRDYVTKWRKMITPSIKEAKFPEWISNPIVVRKKKRKWRVCVSFTDLNKARLSERLFPSTKKRSASGLGSWTWKNEFIGCLLWLSLNPSIWPRLRKHGAHYYNRHVLLQDYAFQPQERPSDVSTASKQNVLREDQKIHGGLCGWYAYKK